MKRALFAAIAASALLAAGVGVFHNLSVNDAQAQNAPVDVVVASGQAVPELGIVDQDAPYH